MNDAIGSPKTRNDQHPNRSTITRSADEPSIAIIGAGFGGLGMAIQLMKQGHRRFTIFEASDGIGGTWRENTYPGAACDVPSHLYCFSFAQKRDWTRKFATQPEILGYINGVADRFQVRPKVRFSTKVTALRWNDDTCDWTVHTDRDEQFQFDVVVSAVGQLHRPNIPDIAGKETFDGPQFHSARWNHGVSLAGKDVVVIGCGASAIQFIPPVAEQARSVTIMQRSANYIAPRNDVEYSPRQLAAYRYVPGLAKARRFRIWSSFESKFVILRKNGRIGKWFMRKYDEGMEPMRKAGLSDEALVPDYPPGCKRLLISDNWFPTLVRPNVSVVTDAIERIEPDAIVAGGASHRADILIWGTGFRANEFLAPMSVTGANGADLNDRWASGAEAYAGVCVSGFPNFFMLYGPNTNLGHNSIVFMIEQQVEYILRILRRMKAERAAAVDVSSGAMSAFNQSLQKRLDQTVWSTDCDSWYKTSAGKITNNWSGLTSSYRAMLRRSDLSEFRFFSPSSDPHRRKPVSEPAETVVTS